MEEKRWGEKRKRRGDEERKTIGKERSANDISALAGHIAPDVQLSAMKGQEGKYRSEL